MSSISGPCPSESYRELFLASSQLLVVCYQSFVFLACSFVPQVIIQHPLCLYPDIPLINTPVPLDGACPNNDPLLTLLYPQRPYFQIRSLLQVLELRTLTSFGGHHSTQNGRCWGMVTKEAPKRNSYQDQIIYFSQYNLGLFYSKNLNVFLNPRIFM